MKEFWTRLILEITFITGSIMALYCLYILWARRSYKSTNKPVGGPANREDIRAILNEKIVSDEEE